MHETLCCVVEYESLSLSVCGSTQSDVCSLSDRDADKMSTLCLAVCLLQVCGCTQHSVGRSTSRHDADETSFVSGEHVG